MAKELLSDMSSEEILFVCKCGNVAHQFVVTLDRYEKWDPEVFVEIKLNPLPFWKRLIHGIKYIFGYKTSFGDFEEVMLSKSHVEPLKRIVETLEQMSD